MCFKKEKPKTVNRTDLNNMNQYKIVIAEGLRQSIYEKNIGHIKADVFGPGFDVKRSMALSEDVLVGEAYDADALIIRPGFILSKKTIDKLVRCKCIVSLGVGYEHIDIKAASSRDILVCNVPDYGTEEVADMAMSHILNLARKISHYDTYLKRRFGEWNWMAGIPIHRLRNQTLGIIGLGRIGTAVALRANGFGLNISYYDPYICESYGNDLGIRKAFSMEEILQTSDIVTIHTPLTDETRGMIDNEFIGKMKKGSILINTARGQIFHSLDTILWALKNNAVRAIATDVLPHEPPSDDHPLLSDWRKGEDWINGRLLISPHAAFYSEESIRELCIKAAIAAKNALTGVQVSYILNATTKKED